MAHPMIKILMEDNYNEKLVDVLDSIISSVDIVSNRLGVYSKQKIIQDFGDFEVLIKEHMASGGDPKPYIRTLWYLVGKDWRKNYERISMEQ